MKQTIELKLRGPGAPCRICSHTTGYFHEKNKNL